LASEDLDAMFKECDVLGKGKIAFPEFMSMMAKKMQQASSEVQLQRAFKAFDLDDDGKIPTSYLTEKLTTQGDKLSRKEVSPRPNLQMQALCDIAENDKQEIVYSMFIDTMFAKNKQAS
jgi:Ca2+-binding EF-hand superfamily protein